MKQIIYKQLLSISYRAKDKALEFLPWLNTAMEQFEINTPLRQAAFIAQVLHESNYFQSLQENLNYSAEGLVKTWPSRFKTVEDAEPYARKPEKIANKIYANRMGNANEASGEGWKHRGAGLIQLTGKDNQTACAEFFKKSSEDIVAWLLTPEGACRSAAYFWWKSDLNELADKENFVAITKKINGGVVGLKERTELYEKAKEALK